MEAEANIEHHHNSLEFYVTCQTKFGEQVRICGNSIQTGNWNPLNGHKLVTDTSIYPLWKSYVPLIIKNQVSLKFKACIVSQNKIVWESNISDREIFPQNPSILKFQFNQNPIVLIPKKIFEIDCREGTFEIIHELQSSQSSSLQFKTNYPLQYYFESQNQEKVVTSRKLSTSDLSSNLVSQNEQNQYDIDGRLVKDSDFLQTENENENKDLEVKRRKTVMPKLMKSRSIKPIQIPFLLDQKRKQLVGKQIRKKLKSRSPSKSIKRSQSGSRGSRKDQTPQSPYMIHVPKLKLQESRKELTAKSPKIPKTISSQNKADQVSTQEKSDVESSSTVVEYETEEQYFRTRDLDVVIEETHPSLTDV